MKTTKTIGAHRKQKDQTLRLDLEYVGFSALPEGRFYVL